MWQQPPVYVSCVLREAVLQSRLLHGDETELVFELDRAEIERALATLALRCVDARSGEAIEPRSVVADVESGGCPGNRAQSDGVTTISGLAPGWRSLEVRAEGYGDYERWVHLAPGARVDLGTIELMPAARLRGRVVDAGGEGVRARITAYSLRTAGSPRDHLDPGPSRETAEDGAFELAGLESDRLRVVARGTDLAWTALDVDARGGDVEGLELRLERGTEVWLSPVRGARTAVQALLLDASGGVLCAFRLHPAGAGWTLRLAPGSYELALVRDNAVVGRQGFQVGAERVVVEVAQP